MPHTICIEGSIEVHECTYSYRREHTGEGMKKKRRARMKALSSWLHESSHNNNNNNNSNEGQDSHSPSTPSLLTNTILLFPALHPPRRPRLGQGHHSGTPNFGPKRSPCIGQILFLKKGCRGPNSETLFLILTRHIVSNDSAVPLPQSRTRERRNKKKQRNKKSGGREISLGTLPGYFWPGYAPRQNRIW